MCARKAVIFDMDGTLIDSGLDFDLIREELGLPQVPLLEAIRDMPEHQRRRCLQVITRHEDRAARESTLFPHARETLNLLASRGVPVALITRNSRRSVDQVLARHGLSFTWIRTREDGEMKPDPEPIRQVCRAMGVEARETVSVGDFAYDLRSAKAARALAVLIVHGPELPDFADEADLVIRSLLEVPPLLEQ
jgi:HAD superfamily hydrolase (TIGR01509 family)